MMLMMVDMMRMIQKIMMMRMLALAFVSNLREYLCQYQFAHNW